MWFVAGHTDMRKGFDGLAAVVHTALTEHPFCGHVFVFRGRHGDLKVLWFGGQGLMGGLGLNYCRDGNAVEAKGSSSR